MFINDRAKRTAPSRRALAFAGVATIVFSLVLSIAPTLAAPGGNGGNGGNGGSGGGNAGTVKIHDATTDLEAGETGNEPHVCTFWIGFYTSDTAETGDWQVVSWAPTGDGSVVASGDYNTAGDGVDTTTVLSLSVGHYRLEWQADGDNSSKHKTFWVECEPAEEPVDPSDDADPSDDSSPSEEAAPTDEASEPTDESSPSEEAAPTDEEEAAPTDEASEPTDESSPSEEAAPTDEESQPTDEEEAAPTDEEEAAPTDEASEPTDESSPSEEAAPTDEEEATPTDEESQPTDEEEAAPTDEEEAAPTDPAQEPEGEVKDGNPEPESGTGGHEAPNQGGAPVLPDTSTSTQESGVLATIGIVLILAAHTGTRRKRTLPSA